MSGKYWMACAAGLGLVASNALATGISYHETWDNYATGLVDPTYNAVWTPDATISPGAWNTISTSNPFTPPNSLLLESRNRGLNNSLVDGVDNTGIGGVGVEMSAGERVVPNGELGDAENLSLGYYHRMATTAMRRFIATYAEMSSGDVHAPVGALALDPLANPIPVLAVGKLNSLFTDSGGGNAENVGIYFFNGQQWVRTALGTGTGYNRYWARIFRDGNDLNWYAQIREDNSGQSGIYPLAAGLDPQALGFDMVSWRQYNSGSSWSGTSVADDIWLSGGRVVPEPATAAMLVLGGLGLLAGRRRRRSA